MSPFADCSSVDECQCMLGDHQVLIGRNHVQLASGTPLEESRRKGEQQQSQLANAPAWRRSVSRATLCSSRYCFSMSADCLRLAQAKQRGDAVEALLVFLAQASGGTKPFLEHLEGLPAFIA